MLTCTLFGEQEAQKSLSWECLFNTVCAGQADIWAWGGRQEFESGVGRFEVDGPRGCRRESWFQLLCQTCLCVCFFSRILEAVHGGDVVSIHHYAMPRATSLLWAATRRFCQAKVPCQLLDHSSCNVVTSSCQCQQCVVSRSDSKQLAEFAQTCQNKRNAFLLPNSVGWAPLSCVRGRLDLARGLWRCLKFRLVPIMPTWQPFFSNGFWHG